MKGRAEDIGTRWERIRALKRAGRLDEAIAALEQEAHDQEAEMGQKGWPVAPAAFEELARLYKRLGNPQAEVAALERLARSRGNDPALHPDEKLRQARARVAAVARGPIAAACPYCAVVLEPPPRESRKCPACGNRIVVRTDRVTGEKQYLTLEGGERFEAGVVAARARAKIMKKVGWLGLGQSDFERTRSELAQQCGRTPSDGDVFWQLANQKVATLKRRRDWCRLGQVYRTMADHLRDESKPAYQMLAAACDAELRCLAEEAGPSGISTELAGVVILAHRGCDVCGRDDQHRIAIAEVLVNKPLPHPDCVFCECTYDPVYPE